MPPRRKNRRELTMYRMPMSWWFVVVSHRTRPTFRVAAEWATTTSPAISATPGRRHACFRRTEHGTPRLSKNLSTVGRGYDAVRRIRPPCEPGFRTTANALEDRGLTPTRMSILRRWGLAGPGLSVIGFGSATPAAAAANTPGQEAINNLFGIVLLFAVAIVIFVQVLLVIVVFRFRKREGHTQSVPNPITHHTGLEAAWTIVPALILLFVGIMTFQTLAVTDTIPQNPDVVVRVIGHQWFWEFVVDDGSGNVTTTVGEFTVRAGQVVKIIVESS